MQHHLHTHFCQQNQKLLNSLFMGHLQGHLTDNLKLLNADSPSYALYFVTHLHAFIFLEASQELQVLHHVLSGGDVDGCANNDIMIFLDCVLPSTAM